MKWNWITGIYNNYLLDQWSLKWCKFTFSVCCHPEILLPWQHDVMTSPLYYLPNKKVYLSWITGWDFFGDMHVHLLGVTNYTHKINNTKFGTWKHFIHSQNLGTIVCGDLNFYLQQVQRADFKTDCYFTSLIR